MSRQSVKAAKRSTKTARRPVKKGVKPVAKNARAADKMASKSARSPVGTTASTQSSVTKSMQTVRSPAMAASVAKMQKMIRTSSPPVQPVAAPEIVVKLHKYQIGEMVYFTSPTFGRAAATGSYTVVKLLPSEGDDYQYRIKSSGEAFERVAKESQLEKM
jgi:hypothetical protein